MRISACLLFFLPCQLLLAAPEALEIGKGNLADLPGGKEADGIIGDFVLRNDRVSAVISGNAPNRRANMSTFYGNDGQTPGCLYDLTLRGTANDEITIFSPAKLRGSVSHVRILKDGSDGEAVVEVYRSAVLGNGLATTHRYHLKDGWAGVLVVSEIRNPGGKAIEDIDVSDEWTRFDSRGDFAGTIWGDAIDRANKCGYCYAIADEKTGGTFKRRESIGAGTRYVKSRFLAVGTSPAMAFSEVIQRRDGVEMGTWKGTVLDPDGAPCPTAKIEILLGDDKIPLYPDAEGAFEINLPIGKHSIRVNDRGRGRVLREVSVGLGKVTTATIEMNKASGLNVEVRDANGSLIPCKLMFKGIGETPNPDLGTVKRARGSKDQYHSHVGAFSVALPAGKYEVTATRGMEHSSHVEVVEVPEGTMVDFRAKLERVVNTKGWISADFHNHSTPSGDNNCGTDDRLMNIAAEQVEFTPTTEHNRIYDWQPHIDRLGLSEEIFTCVGMELTGRGAHLNTFPLTVKPGVQDGGAPVWVRDPRINAINLRRFNDNDTARWVQINHPNLTELFFDRNGDGKIDNGWFQLGGFLNGFETENYRDTHILDDGPFYIVPGKGISRTVRENRPFIWLQLLNQGHRTWGVAVCDAHSVHQNGVGVWRTYLPTENDAPAKQDLDALVQHAQNGHMMLTSGPYLEVNLADGVHYGDTHEASDGKVSLGIKVQCTDWVDIDRVQVLVNGVQVPELNFTRESHQEWFQDGVVRFDQTVEVKLESDAHLIVVAIDEDGNLERGFGTSPGAKNKPCAYHNPFFIDVDGGGFQANGDTLGWDLPAKGVTVEKVEKMLESRK